MKTARPAIGQSWHLVKSMDPVKAVNTGTDCVCGDCRHRKRGRGRTCYVNMGRSAAVWRAYQAGRYPLLTEYDHLENHLAGRHVRWGAYGDPAICSADLIRSVNSYALGHTAYTHQWREDWAKEHRGHMMASVDSQIEADVAHYYGWKTFKVVPVGLRFQNPALLNA